MAPFVKTLKSDINMHHWSQHKHMPRITNNTHIFFKLNTVKQFYWSQWPTFSPQIMSFIVKWAHNLTPSPKLQTVNHTAFQFCSHFPHLSSKRGGTHNVTCTNDIQELGLLKIQAQLLETSPEMVEAQMAGTQGDCWMKTSGKNVIPEANPDKQFQEEKNVWLNVSALFK